MDVGYKVICIGEYCYKLKRGGIYEIEYMWGEDTVSIKGYDVLYSSRLFMDVNEYRRNVILKIKEKKEVK